MQNAAGLGTRIRDWLLVEAQPGSGSFVMATGSSRWAWSISGHSRIADALLAVCALGWIVLAAAFLYRLVARTDEWWLETTQLGALTAVAGSTVLAAALNTILGWRLVPLLLWMVAATLWVVVILRTLVRLPPRAPRGLVFLLTVATQGVSLVASSLAVGYDADWFVYLAFALWVVGIAFYLLIELHDFDYGTITSGPGDQWIFGGAVFPRFRYSAMRWATVFPVGMFAACTLVASEALGMAWMDTYFADWWVWIGLGVWATVCAGLVRRIGWLALGRRRAARPVADVGRAATRQLPSKRPTPQG